jgi:hypothetical protein
VENVVRELLERALALLLRGVLGLAQRGGDVAVTLALEEAHQHQVAVGAGQRGDALVQHGQRLAPHAAPRRRGGVLGEGRELAPVRRLAPQRVRALQQRDAMQPAGERRLRAEFRGALGERGEDVLGNVLRQFTPPRAPHRQAEDQPQMPLHQRAERLLAPAVAERREQVGVSERDGGHGLFDGYTVVHAPKPTSSLTRTPELNHGWTRMGKTTAP